MRAFHGDKAIKAKYLARVRAHRKGCAVGCTLEAYDHAQYPTEWGIPEQIVYLEGRLFELSTKADAKKWPAQFLRAIPVGADLSDVWSKWVQWMLVSADFGVVRYARTEAERGVIEGVAEMYRVGGT